MALSDDLERVAEAAATFAAPGEQVAGILAAEPREGERVYLCAFEAGGGHVWLGLDGDGQPVADRRLVRDAASIAALCEVAEESAGGGDLAALRARLAELRETERPVGIEEAEEAAAALEAAIRPAPRLATQLYLDSLGAAARRLERSLGEDGGSPFAVAMQQAMAAVEQLATEVEQRYKGPLR
jgi:hypothetical protein